MKHECEREEDCVIECENEQWWFEEDLDADCCFFKINFCPFCGLNLNEAPLKLSEYVAREIKKGRKKFDIGVEPDMTVNDKSLNRVKFGVK